LDFTLSVKQFCSWLPFHQGAPTTLGRLRQYAEHMAKSLAARNGLELDRQVNFDETLRAPKQAGLLPRQAGDVFHFLRKAGSAALHDNRGTPEQALAGLKLAQQLGASFMRAYRSDRTLRPAPFDTPLTPKGATAALTEQSTGCAEMAEIEGARTALAIDGTPHAASGGGAAIPHSVSGLPPLRPVM
jgi:type I restriction enzyme R subunit